MTIYVSAHSGHQERPSPHWQGAKGAIPGKNSAKVYASAILNDLEIAESNALWQRRRHYGTTTTQNRQTQSSQTSTQAQESRRKIGKLLIFAPSFFPGTF
ncbi:MAG: hypothetical protein JJU29_23805 [Verrucomicrobia bacterium]|nr:hypothetical protein [Verrucomicrobiota bacterium]MCH8510623.1 hypothetical protein [Kiritimatiellia bacterium]